MVLMRRLLLEAQCKFRKMMSDNKALASRIDQDIQSAHLQVSALRAELADTNQRIRDICSASETSGMAGNVITTCMPPTSTTNTAVSSTADGQWTKEVKPGQPVTRADSVAAISRVSSASPPIADKGGTKTVSDRVHPADQTHYLTVTQSPKSLAGSKATEQKTNVENGPSPDQVTKNKYGDLTSKEQNVKVTNSPAKRNLSAVSPEKQHLLHKQTSKENITPTHQLRKDSKDKPDSLTESSEASEETNLSKHRSHRRERRSLKGSDVQKSLLNDLKCQQVNGKQLDGFKTELQRSESDGNQNSAPECDLSLSGSPFKEDSTKVSQEKSSTLGSSTQTGAKELTVEESKAEDFSLDIHRSSPPVKDDSNAHSFSFHKSSTNGCSQKDLHDGHRYKAKTKSDPLDKRRDKCAQEYSVLSSPSSVMKHKAGASRGICSWEERRFECQELSPASAWYKTQDNSSSVSGKSVLDESSSKEETSDSQDGLPSEFCDRMGVRNEEQGRYVVFDSKDIRRPCRQWRTALSESYRDQQISDSWKSSLCDTTEKSDPKLSDKRQTPEKDDQVSSNLIQESSYFRKSTNSDYSSYNNASKSQDDTPTSVVQLMAEIEALKIKNSALLRDLEEVMESRDEKAKENAAMAAKLEQMDKELKHAKEALSGKLFSKHLSFRISELRWQDRL
ncbi:kazrin-like isoform X2 [Stegodyphus dumicola]|nr:kazrin-like isoform X2 [Stegodyphus dumicola]XP_035219326.1 kazrin-like isoform X2 [Stegodyphus dumicola]